MGIPKFARWISHKYPEMVQRTPPPNVAGLYIDMNGIIHPCCHSEDDPRVAERTEDEKLSSICIAVEDLVAVMNPTNILYLAMDGVAPRAKMNQQRSRRYSSACTALEATHGMDHYSVDDQKKAEVELQAAKKDLELGIFGAPDLDQLQAEMCSPPSSPTGEGATFGGGVFGAPESPLSTQPEALAEYRDATVAPKVVKFDSNCISPGTDFMYKCADRVRTFIAEKMASEDPADQVWKTRTVILSDTNTPGEGEHKFIDFIRTQVTMKSSLMSGGAHVVVGLDADLILLCLSLHHQNVWIMRDRKRTPPPTTRAVAVAADATEETGGMPASESAGSLVGDEQHPTTKTVGDGGDEHQHGDGNRAVDAAPRRYEYFKVSTVGDGIVSELTAMISNPHVAGMSLRLADCPGGGPKMIDDFIAMATLLGNDFVPRLPSGFCGESAMDNLMELYIREVLPHGNLTTPDGDLELRSMYRLVQAFAKIEVMKFRQVRIKQGKMDEREAASATLLSSATATSVDEGWRKDYYTTTTITKDKLSDACREYVDGLRFVWQYYSKTSNECPWKWNYPYHHAPLAVDLALYLSSMPEVKPLPSSAKAPSPFTQLMCILPPTSHRLLPKPFAAVMLSPPAELRDTFPLQWGVDYTAAGGKEHLSVAKIPFANLERLEGVETDLELAGEFDLTQEEVQRGINNYYHEIILPVESPLAASVESGEVETQRSILFGDVSPLLDAKGDAKFKNVHPSVAILKFEDVVPPTTLKPRMYNSTLPVTNITQSRFEAKKAHRDAKKPHSSPAKGGNGGGNGGGAASAEQGRSANLSGLTTIVGACVILSHLVSSLLGSAPLGTFLFDYLPLMTAVSCAVLLLFNAAGCAGFGGWGRSVLQRNNIRDTNVDWQCPKCLCINFSRNQWCFQCQCPYDCKNCPAVFSARMPSSPPLYEADHSVSEERVRLKPVV